MESEENLLWKDLETLVKETWTEITYVVPFGLYFHFYWPGQPNRIIDAPSSSEHGKCLDGLTDIYGFNYGRLEQKIVSRSERTTVREDAKEVLASEYKIHLMPKKEYLLPIARTLCQLLKEDPEFRQAVCHLKIKMDPSPYYLDDTQTITLPIIVIYPALSKDNAQLVLDKVYEGLHNYDPSKSGLNITPRDNRRINELIYYAQSSGDLKSRYRRLREPNHNTQFTQTFAHFLGDYHLQDPQEKYSFTVFFTNFLNRLTSLWKAH